jgi:hypothetical protein
MKRNSYSNAFGMSGTVAILGTGNSVMAAQPLKYNNRDGEKILSIFFRDKNGTLLTFKSGMTIHATLVVE